MTMTPLTEVAASWGLNDSTLRKQADKRFKARMAGHTLFVDDEGEDFLAWLREHVLSQRQRRHWPALVELANLTMASRKWPQGAPRYTQATLQQPLEALIWTLRQWLVADGATLDERGAQARQACENALVAYVERPDIVTSLFFRLLAEPYHGSLQEMLKQERLLLYAYAIYQEEGLQEQAAIFSSKGKEDLALGDEPVQAGEAYAIRVTGFSIEGRAAFDARHGWHLVASDTSVILLRPGMRGWLLSDSPAQPNEKTS
jgi:hypothetical protein